MNKKIVLAIAFMLLAPSLYAFPALDISLVNAVRAFSLAAAQKAQGEITINITAASNPVPKEVLDKLVNGGAIKIQLKTNSGLQDVNPNYSVENGKIKTSLEYGAYTFTLNIGSFNESYNFTIPDTMALQINVPADKAQELMGSVLPGEITDKLQVAMESFPEDIQEEFNMLLNAGYDVSKDESNISFLQDFDDFSVKFAYDLSEKERFNLAINYLDVPKNNILTSCYDSHSEGDFDIGETGQINLDEQIGFTLYTEILFDAGNEDAISALLEENVFAYCRGEEPTPAVYENCTFSLKVAEKGVFSDTKVLEENKGKINVYPMKDDGATDKSSPVVVPILSAITDGEAFYKFDFSKINAGKYRFDSTFIDAGDSVDLTGNNYYPSADSYIQLVKVEDKCEFYKRDN